jgi:hypothetical protein
MTTSVNRPKSGLAHYAPPLSPRGLPAQQGGDRGLETISTIHPRSTTRSENRSYKSDAWRKDQTLVFIPPTFFRLNREGGRGAVVLGERGPASAWSARGGVASWG